MTPEETKQWIWSRCTDCGSCRLWEGAVSDGDSPIVRLPGSRKLEGARRVLLKALGKNIDGLLATVTCGNPTCLSEKHVVAWTRQRLQKRSGPKVSNSVQRSAKLAIHSRRRGKLSMELVRQGRAQGLTTRAAAALWGVTQSTAHKALRGDHWKEYGGLLSGLTAANDGRRKAA